MSGSVSNGENREVDSITTNETGKTTMDAKTIKAEAKKNLEKMKELVIWTLILSIRISLFAQTGLCSCDSTNLHKVIAIKSKCDTLSLIKCCTNYQYSRKPNSDISKFMTREDVEKNLMTLDLSDARNFYRLERFTALFYVHHMLILRDTVRKDRVILKVNGINIFDCSFNLKEVSTDTPIDTVSKRYAIINKRHDKEIYAYYSILKKYLDNAGKFGRDRARVLYLNELKKYKIAWIY